MRYLALLPRMSTPRLLDAARIYYHRSQQAADRRSPHHGDWFAVYGECVRRGIPEPVLLKEILK